MVNSFPQVLTIAGSDSDGSAGVQADLHTFFSRKVYGLSVITACVSGNSYGIHASEPLPLAFVKQQFKDVAADFKIRACKTGMLADSALLETVAACYQRYDLGPLVVDPVIMTKHGNMLLEESAFATMRSKLLPLATVVTPNYYEAQKLSQVELTDDAAIVLAATKLQQMGAKNVVIKGYHQDKEQKEVRDFVLLENGKNFWLSEPYYHTLRINGTGDSLSACIAAELAKGTNIENAVRIAKKYVNTAIKHELQIGHKFGPINHWAAQSLE